MAWDDRGNSVQAWDLAYAPGGHWDEVAGDAMTAAFGRCILDNVHHKVTEALSRPGARVLDWGCGRGQVTALVRERFPEALAVGLDFSEVAVTQAAERYGEPFIMEPNGEVYGEWDVIVNSNVLEHMPDPLGVVRDHLAHAEFYVILTPHEEDLGPGAVLSIDERIAAGHAHVHRFGLGSFPGSLDQAACIQREVVRPGPEWPGEQLLVVYRC